MRERKPDDSFDGLFDEDLAATLEAAAAEHRAVQARHLVTRLEQVRARGVPLRGAEAFGTDGVVRLRFADGTAVLVRGNERGSLSTVAVAVVRSIPVLLSDVHDDGRAVRAEFRWNQRHHVGVEVLGYDQPR